MRVNLGTYSMSLGLAMELEGDRGHNIALATRNKSWEDTSSVLKAVLWSNMKTTNGFAWISPLNLQYLIESERQDRIPSGSRNVSNHSGNRSKICTAFIRINSRLPVVLQEFFLIFSHHARQGSIFSTEGEARKSSNLAIWGRNHVQFAIVHENFWICRMPGFKFGPGSGQWPGDF